MRHYLVVFHPAIRFFAMASFGPIGAHFAVSSAAAQFVCGGSMTGAEPQTGQAAVATGGSSTACGAGSTANAGSTAIGAGSTATDPVYGADTAVGAQATATGAQTVAVGASSTAAYAGTALGSLSSASGSNGGAPGNFGFSTAIGNASTANGYASTAIAGYAATANGYASTAIELHSVTGTAGDPGGNGDIAIGGRASTAVSSGAQTSGNIAIGSSTGYVSGNGSGVPTTTGPTTANGGNSIAIGTAALASGASSLAFGGNAQATNTAAMAFGLNSAATGVNSIAIGNGTIATGSVAVGAGALASNRGAAFGDGAVATGTNATAVGPGASATFANSSALGAGATATAANQMAFGSASNTYRMPGLTSAASLSAQSGPTSFVTTDANGNLAATNFSMQSMSNLSANVSALQQDVAALQQNFDQGLHQAFEGTAIAIALSGAALPSDKRFAITTNWGNFRGTNAMSLVAQARISNDVVANAGLAGGIPVRWDWHPSRYDVRVVAVRRHSGLARCYPGLVQLDQNRLHMFLATPAGGRNDRCREPGGRRACRHDLVGRGASGARAQAAGATCGAKPAAGAGAEAGADRSQRRADPNPHDATGPRPGQQDRQLHCPARSGLAGISGQQRGAARRNLRPAAPR